MAMLFLLSANALAQGQVVESIRGKIYSGAVDPGDSGASLWVSSWSGDPVANGHTDLLAFSVGGTFYSTGVDDGMLDGVSLDYLPTVFQSFSPDYASVQPKNDTYTGIPLSRAAFYNSEAPLGTYLHDGQRGLDVGTAIFNIRAGRLVFDASITNPATIDDEVPDIIVTQVGETGGSSAVDVFSFTDAQGNIVGNSVSAVFANTQVVGRQNWAFFQGGSQQFPGSNGMRNLRIRAFRLSDFGIVAGDIANIAHFVQQLNGASDVAFVAYNVDTMAVPTADLIISKTNNTEILVVGSPTTYEIVVTNLGPGQAHGAVVRDTPVQGLDCLSPPASLTCVPSGGAACPSPLPLAGLQDPGLPVQTLPSGGSIVLSLTCTVVAPVE